MIELGALLGAIFLTLVGFVGVFTDSGDDFGALVLVVFFGGPVLGALWGGGVAAAIHFVSTLLGVA